MSRYFVDGASVAVYEFDAESVMAEAAPNVIWIKSRMDMATQAKVQSELMQIAADGKTLEAHLGQNQLALLIHNIVKWDGPDLGMIPCTAENIRRLDPNEPHLALVLEEIAKRNTRTPSPLPKSPGGNTSASDGEAALIVTPLRANTPAR